MLMLFRENEADKSLYRDGIMFLLVGPMGSNPSIRVFALVKYEGLLRLNPYEHCKQNHSLASAVESVRNEQCLCILI